MRLSTVLGWGTTSDSVNPRKPLVGASEARTPTYAFTPRAVQKASVDAGSGTSSRTESMVAMSALLVDAQEVARGVAERAVTDSVGLLRRLLDDLGARGLQPLEGPVQVLRGQQQHPVGALGHHLADDAALVVGDTGVDGRRVQDDRRGVGLAGRSDGHPAH